MMGSKIFRFPLMGLSLLALLAAIWAGLIRIGWPWLLLQPLLPAVHGPLMVSGFLGTLIGIERAVALKVRWAFLSPLLSGLGGFLLLVGAPIIMGKWLMALGSLILALLFLYLAREHPAWHTAAMAVGSLMWLVGNVLWLLGLPIYQAVVWWMAFLVLTIAGERLELSRVLQPTPHVKKYFAGATSVFLSGVLLSTWMYKPGMRLAGVGLALLAVWLFRHDLAPRNLRKKGLVRFIAVCLVCGYFWLLLTGLLALWFGGVPAGPAYDAILHALFLGFVFSMIFGHALLIFPAVLGTSLPYSPLFYSHVCLLQFSLALRIAGDLLPWATGRRIGGLLNGVAILMFLAMTAGALILHRATRATTKPKQEIPLP